MGILVLRSLMATMPSRTSRPFSHVNAYDSSENSVVHYAASYGWMSCLHVNAYDSSENSVVHYAASYGWMSCLQSLSDAGADLWSRNSWGIVLLICAMLKQRTVCADFILVRENEQRFLDFATARDKPCCSCSASTRLMWHRSYTCWRKGSTRISETVTTSDRSTS
jgi:hypothetical protein